MKKHMGWPMYKPMGCYRGDTFEFALRLIGRRRDTGEAYLIDTTGWQARYQVRESVNGVGVLTAAMIITGVRGDPGHETNLTVRVGPETTEKYPHGAVWRYDLELTDPSGRRMTVMYGEFYVQGDIAK